MTRMNEKVFNKAIEMALPTIQIMMNHGVAKRHHLQIYAGGVKESVIVSKSLGDTKDWENQYDEVAMSKFKLTQEHKMSTRDIQQKKPNVLGVPGTTIWWGSWIESDIVVACSGVQPWIDELISKIIVDIILGLMYTIQNDEFERLKADGQNFY